MKSNLHIINHIAVSKEINTVIPPIFKFREERGARD